MILQYKKEYFSDTYSFLRNNKNSDFYYTENNIRKYIETEKDLRRFISISKTIYVVEEKKDILGIISIWESINNNNSRYFIKINAINDNIVDKLLTILLWNSYKDLYIKIRKNSSFLRIFYKKGFKFVGDRGKEVLLFRLNTNKKENDITIKQD